MVHATRDGKLLVLGFFFEVSQYFYFINLFY